MVTTMIQCANGETVLASLNTCLPRPYSRGGLVQGTRGSGWRRGAACIWTVGARPTSGYPPISIWLSSIIPYGWNTSGRGVHEAGHDGMDYLCMCALVESIQEGIAPPIDVYDAATWMAITVLSEQSSPWAARRSPSPILPAGNGSIAGRGRSANTRSIAYAASCSECTPLGKEACR